MKYSKDGAGIKNNRNGEVRLYEGYRLLKVQAYSRYCVREKIIEQFKKDVRNLHGNYYIVIAPNLVTS